MVVADPGQVGAKCRPLRVSALEGRGSIHDRLLLGIDLLPTGHRRPGTGLVTPRVAGAEDPAGMSNPLSTNWATAAGDPRENRPAATHWLIGGQDHRALVASGPGGDR